MSISLGALFVKYFAFQLKVSERNFSGTSFLYETIMGQRI